jgi:hypothetical protein
VLRARVEPAIGVVVPQVPRLPRQDRLAAPRAPDGPGRDPWRERSAQRLCRRPYPRSRVDGRGVATFGTLPPPPGERERFWLYRAKLWGKKPRDHDRALRQRQKNPVALRHVGSFCAL